MSDEEEIAQEPKAGSWVLTLLVCLGLVVVAGLLLWWIFSTQPKAERTTETRQTPMLVQVAAVERGTFRPTIGAMGKVAAASEITVSPRVSGRILERADGFSPGGFLREGEALVTIDPADYRVILEQQESALQQAKADLNIEMGRQKVAESDLGLLTENLPERNRDLVLRRPQLETAQARVAAAQAAVDRARLDLERTTIVAPFDAQVLERAVDVGSQVDPGNNLGRLVGTGTYWVVTTVRLSALPWIEVAEEGDGSVVTLRNRAAWPAGSTRKGRVERLIGALDDETRLARLLVTVADPLARSPERSDEPALILGAILEAEIMGREIAGVVRLDRSYLRENDTVWIMDDEDRLRIAEVNVVFRDARYAYVKDGLEDGDEVVTTNLATVAEGAPLRLQTESE